MSAATKNRQNDLTSVFQEGTKLAFKKGEFIIHPGEAPGGVFFIESGLVKAYDISKYGEENLLIIRKNNEIFPLIWAVTGQERDIIYQALDNVVVWRIPRKKYSEHLKKSPETLLAMLEMTVEMYRLHSEHILNLEYRTIRERVIIFLLNTAERFGEVRKDSSVLLDVPLKQQDIASSINARRESTSRELVRLERLGLLANEQGKIVILSPIKLRKNL
jgi:CRP-like cAMP-binding protein